MTRATSDTAVDALDLPDEVTKPVLAPVGELVGAAEYTGVKKGSDGENTMARLTTSD